MCIKYEFVIENSIHVHFIMIFKRRLHIMESLVNLKYYWYDNLAV